MATATTMTLNMSEKEMAALDAMASDKDVSKTQIMRQALRLYQLVDKRIKAGEKLMFSGDKQRVIEFVGL